MEENILSKIIPCLKLCLIFILASILGAITAPCTILVPFVYTVIYACAYIYWKANNHKFPYYFHIGLMFLIANNEASGIQSVVGIIKWGLIFTVVLLLITFIKFRKKHIPLYSSNKRTQSIKTNYMEFIKKNPSIINRMLIHCLIIFIISWVSYFAYDQRGYWIIVSAATVLIGGEYEKISAKGKRRILGAFISMVVLGGLVFFGANNVVLIVFMLIAMKGMVVFMPDKYIMGSACIGIQATIGKILSSGDLSYTIVLQRVLWTIVGAALTVALCYISDKLIPSLYQNYTEEIL